jgi:hypothetical protein
MLFDRIVWEDTHAMYDQFIERTTSGCNQLDAAQGSKPAAGDGSAPRYSTAEPTAIQGGPRPGQRTQPACFAAQHVHRFSPVDANL